MRLRSYAVAAVALTLAAACSSSSSGGSAHTAATPPPASGTANAPADPAAAKAQITTNWQLFFAYTTPRSRAVQLVQGGAGLSAALAAAAQLQQQTHIRQEEAKVTGVVFTSPTQATVSYQLLNGTNVLLPTATGTAVLVNGTWLVSKATLCALVQLGSNGKAVPGC
jgi:hypothetical protein